ncbi:hypothetical protein FisN_UnNu059 [Fistulifera solaris]|uniref:Uncharacterized protein n=1 Tax=Fistulifera solaris TaxID=1519565 RepID=A0A1Z5JQ65_FISSO|nr:hypothetical protein FisN_UnNu059 [Fistulifera solaris]|eukprot:GAX15908.1 hypothetical protein FisN_UnNu059 [Fistulifera solaris]
MKYLLLTILYCCRLLLLPAMSCAWTTRPLPRPIVRTPIFLPRQNQLPRRTFTSCPAKTNSTRDTARSWMGLSLTAIRATARAATGISLTAIYASTLAATSLWIRQTMKWILSLVPPPLRYFAQPFLVLYYAPLFWIRQVSHNGARRKHQKGTHEALLEGWKQAVAQADKTVSYWPIHVSQDGALESDLSEMDVSDAISESIELTYDKHKDAP